MKPLNSSVPDATVYAHSQVATSTLNIGRHAGVVHTLALDECSAFHFLDVVEPPRHHLQILRTLSAARCATLRMHSELAVTTFCDRLPLPVVLTSIGLMAQMRATKCRSVADATFTLTG